MGNYSMPRYFQNMPVVGKPVRANAENVAELKAIEEDIHNHIVDALEAGKPDADMNAIFIAIVEQARAELAKEGRKPA